MRKAIKLNDALGKTVDAVAFSSDLRQLVFTLNDSTFITVGLVRGHEDVDDTLGEEDLVIESFGDAALVRLGILTGEELFSRRTKQEAERQRRLLEYNRREYERLRAIFDVPPSKSPG